jgi:endonuclease/exonuclease/phosphatase family metal-dependent hydrolase
VIDYDAGYGDLRETTVRVATWNVWGRYGPWDRRRAAIVETLRSVDADIVGLQEVWDADGTTLAHDIARELGYPHVTYGRNLDFGTWAAGNAIISRQPFNRTEVVVLPRDADQLRDDEGEERICVFAEIAGVADKEPIQVFCAHLSWRADHSAVRQRQVAAICEFVRAQRPRQFPAVLLGDLNSTPDSDEIRMLTGAKAPPTAGVVFRDAWLQVHPNDPGHTWDNANPFAAASLNTGMRIDYILLGMPKSGGCGHPIRIERVGVQPVDGMIGSDHYGLVADLRY